MEEPRNLPARCFQAHPPSPMTPRFRPPAETSSTWPTSTHPAVGFSRGTNKLHAVPPWSQEWIATRPCSGPSIWAVLLHRMVVQSGLQHHRKVSRLHMVVELPATAMPPHGASARASLLSKPFAATAPSVYLHTTDQELAQSPQSHDYTQLVHSTCWQSLITEWSRPPLPLS